ncbi:putative ribonuclease H-like domain-containing protein [Tanacetum coccineum]|uniref:Ribonuclease H-like domain-containing protein n=1 Tax=Tanacetum coccineum TaxID=301880 RepID=A0ABQ5EH04_9ASTR
MTQTVPSKSTANVTYQGTARSRVPQAVLSRNNKTQEYEKFYGLRREGNPEEDLKDYAIIDSGCSGSMTGDKDKLSDFKEFKVSYVEELKINLLSVSFKSVIRSNNVLFPDKKVLSYLQIQFVDEDLTNDEVCFMAQKIGACKSTRTLTSWFKAIWLSLNFTRPFKIGSLRVLHVTKGNNTGLLAKRLKKELSDEPLELLHMDLFGPVLVESINKKKYCLVVTDDCSKFSWVFFLAYKDETYDMLHDLIVGLENRLRHKVKTIRTPQQNGVAERKNRTLIEAARTMLADSLLPIQFWAEAVNTACYVLNRVLVTKPQMKTPYEILMGRSPNISFMRPFGCSLTILNTLDQLGKFDGKSEEGYLLGYSTSSKGFRVYNRVTRKVQECLHVDFLENQENQKGKVLIEIV